MKCYCRLILLLVICLLNIKSGLSQTDSLFQHHTIKVMCGNAYPPFEFINEKGEPDGFNIDLLHAIMKELNLSYTLKMENWAKVVDALKNKEIDMVMGMTYSLSRAESIKFGQAHAYINEVLAVEISSPYHFINDLEGKRIAVHNGGYAHEYLKNRGINIQIIAVPETEQGFRLMAEGKCDAVLCNEGTARFFAKKNKKYQSIRYIPSGIEPSEYRIAANWDSSSLLPIMNKGLYLLRSNGEYDRIYQKWFGESDSSRYLRYVSILGLILLIGVILSTIFVYFYRHQVKRAVRRIRIQNKIINEQMHKIKSEEEALNKILDSIPVPVQITDLENNGEYIYWNKESSLRFGDGLHKMVNDIARKDVAYEIALIDRKVYTTGESYKGQQTFTLSNGTKFETMLFKDIIVLNDKRYILTVRWVINDLIRIQNELKEAKEEAERNDKLKSAFLANMSHEIRTPLNAIVGFSQMMGTESSTPEEKEEFSRIIQLNSDLLLKLISDILDLSKIESGLMDLKPIEFDFSKHFRDMAKTYSQRITNPDVQLICEDPYEACFVVLDRDRVTQVLTNFVTNAIKFTAKGYIKMSYECDNKGIRIQVEDTGIGIAKENQSKVFIRFQKLNDFAQGTGLGMSISKAIADACGGDIGLRSQLGVGTTFWIYLPCEVHVRMKDED